MTADEQRRQDQQVALLQDALAGRLRYAEQQVEIAVAEVRARAQRAPAPRRRRPFRHLATCRP